MQHDTTDIRKKKFTITVSPQYQGGRLLLLTSAETKRVAKCLLLDPDMKDPNDSMLKWAEEVYFAGTQA